MSQDAMRLTFDPTPPRLRNLDSFAKAWPAASATLEPKMKPFDDESRRALQHRLHDAQLKLRIAHAQRDALAATIDAYAEKSSPISSASLIQLAAAERFARHAEAEMIEAQNAIIMATESKDNRSAGM